MEDFFGQVWVQVLLGAMLVGLIIWWIKFRPES